MAAGREGRGWLSSIDQLPEEAQDDIVWAAEQLDERRRSQEDIRNQLNERLEAKGCAPLSKSAFSRYSTKRAAVARRLDEARRIYEGISPHFTPAKIDEGNVLLAEMIKLLVFELVQRDANKQTPKGAMELARAFQSAVHAQKTSTERRRKLEAEFVAKTNDAIDRVTREVGLPADRIAQIRRDVLGLRGDAATAQGGS